MNRFTFPRQRAHTKCLFIYVDIDIEGIIVKMEQSIRREIIFQFIERIQKEVSFYSINEKYTNEIDAQLQSQRMKNIFETCIQYIELTFCLPSLMVQLPESIFHLENSLTHCKDTDPKFSQLLNVLDQKSVIKMLENVECQVFKIKWKLKKKKELIFIVFLFLLKMPTNGRNIVLLLTELKRIADNKISTNTSLELAKQKVLHQIWSENDMNMRKIDQLRQGMNEIQMKFNTNSMIKRNEIQRFELEKEQLIQKSTNDFTRLM